MKQCSLLSVISYLYDSRLFLHRYGNAVEQLIVCEIKRLQRLQCLMACVVEV